MTSSELSGRTELAILQPHALPPDVHRVASEVIQGGYAGIVVAPVWVARVAAMLRASDTRAGVTAVVAFPHGASKPTVKAIEATSCLKDGADAVAVVPHLANLVRLDAEAMRAELLEIVRAARAVRRYALVHVVVESALLARLANSAQHLDAALDAACRAIRESGCDGVVTATGFHPAGGATVEAVAGLKRHAESLLVITAGGVGDEDTARSLLSAGADRVWRDAFSA